MLVFVLLRMLHRAPSGSLAGVADSLIEDWAQWRRRPGAFARAFREIFLDEHGVWRAWEVHNGRTVRNLETARERARSQRRIEPFRLMVYERDGFRCRRCQRSAAEVTLSLDHVIPLSRGGSDDPSNLQTLCLPCNLAKGADIE